MHPRLNGLQELSEPKGLSRAKRNVEELMVLSLIDIQMVISLALLLYLKVV